MLHMLSLYLISKNKTWCLQVDFHLVGEYNQNTSTLDVGLSKTDYKHS